MIPERELFDLACKNLVYLLESSIDRRRFTLTDDMSFNSIPLAISIKRLGYEDLCHHFTWYRPFMPDGRSGCVLFFRETDHWAHRLEPAEFTPELTYTTELRITKTQLCFEHFLTVCDQPYGLKRYFRYTDLMEYIEDLMDGKYDRPHPRWKLDAFRTSSYRFKRDRLENVLNNMLYRFFTVREARPRWDHSCRTRRTSAQKVCEHRKEVKQ